MVAVRTASGGQDLGLVPLGDQCLLCVLFAWFRMHLNTPRTHARDCNSMRAMATHHHRATQGASTR
jgi:hypothetical protein